MRSLAVGCGQFAVGLTLAVAAFLLFVKGTGPEARGAAWALPLVAYPMMVFASVRLFCEPGTLAELRTPPVYLALWVAVLSEVLVGWVYWTMATRGQGMLAASLVAVPMVVALIWVAVRHFLGLEAEQREGP